MPYKRFPYTEYFGSPIFWYADLYGFFGFPIFLYTPFLGCFKGDDLGPHKPHQPDPQPILYQIYLKTLGRA